MENNEINDVIVPRGWESNDIITVLGVGGGGCNAVNYMKESGITGCNFIVCNTDAQALDGCSVQTRIILGDRGLGAGCDPVKGRNAALNSQEEIERVALNSKTQMLFITAGMGGGTGTGASPVIAKMAKEKGILTVAVVTIPFKNEGNKSMTRAIEGIHELEKNVDSLLIINNEKLYEYYGSMLAHEAFPKADEVLATAVRGVTEIITKRGYINVDFEDVRTMMKDSGMALLGCGVGRGENRIEDAVREAFKSPLLNDFDLKTAKNVLVNITASRSDKGVKMDELNEINAKIDEYTGGANNFKRGLIWDDDPALEDSIHITSIVTGLKFSDVIGSEKELGDYVMIDRNYVYVKPEYKKPEGRTEIAHNRHIGYMSKENEIIVKFDPEKKPALLSGASIVDLESVPAIRRIQ